MVLCSRLSWGTGESSLHLQLLENGDFLSSFRLEDLFVFTCVPILGLVFGDAVTEEQRAGLERDRSVLFLLERLLERRRREGAVMTFVCVLLVLAVNVHDAVPRWPWRLEGSRVGEQLFSLLLLLRSHVVDCVALV